MSKIVKFNTETFQGTVTEKAFMKECPADLPKEVFQRVDQFREERLAAIENEVLDFAEKHGVGAGEGTGVSVSDIPMGGQAVGQVYVDSSFKLVAEVAYTQGDIMKAVLSRSCELFDQHNNVVEPANATDA